MYSGPIIDTLLHTPWLGPPGASDPRGDVVDWSGDARLRRVMQTFQHETTPGDSEGNLTRDQLLKEMEGAQVERAVIPAKVYYPTSVASVKSLHEVMADFVGGTQDKLMAVGTIVPPESGPGSYWDVLQTTEMLTETVNKFGFVGTHIVPASWAMPPNHKWFYPLYAKCVELRVAVFVHVGMPGPLWPMGPNNPQYLDEVALAFPDLTIIAHHIGDPWTDISVRLAARHQNVYICTSAWMPIRYPHHLVEFMRGTWHGTPGSKKVLFASDFPLLDMKKTTDQARALDISDDGLADFLYNNARRLFWPE